MVLLRRRQDLRITQQELADLSGVGINTIVAIENHSGNPSFKTLMKIINALGLELSIKPRTL